jgi:hypothetical protein
MSHIAASFQRNRDGRDRGAPQSNRQNAICAKLPFEVRFKSSNARDERAHCSLTGFTEWPHENQTLAKFRGYHSFGFSSQKFLASRRRKE